MNNEIAAEEFELRLAASNEELQTQTLAMGEHVRALEALLLRKQALLVEMRQLWERLQQEDSRLRRDFAALQGKRPVA